MIGSTEGMAVKSRLEKNPQSNSSKKNPVTIP